MSTIILDFFRAVWRGPFGPTGLAILGLCVALAVIGPAIAPYDPVARNYDAAGVFAGIKVQR